MEYKKAVKEKSSSSKKEIDYNGIIARNVKNSRISMQTSKMSRKTLGDAIGVSEDMIKSIENGFGCRSDVLCKISAALGVSVNWLITDHLESEEKDFTTMLNISYNLLAIRKQMEKMELDMKDCNDLLKEIDILKNKIQELETENKKFQKN